MEMRENFSLFIRHVPSLVPSSKNKQGSVQYGEKLGEQELTLYKAMMINISCGIILTLTICDSLLP